MSTSFASRTAFYNFQSTPGQVDILKVDDDGNGDFLTISGAIAAATNGDIIIVTGGADDTHNEANIVVDKSLTIQGDANATINADQLGRIFKIDDGDNTTTSFVDIVGLTLTGGYAVNGSGENDNDDGGAIWNREDLLLFASTAVDNEASDDGGGIRNDGILVVKQSQILSNSSGGNSDTSGGGGILNTTSGSLFVAETTIAGNTALNGGGIRNDGRLIITRSTLTENAATGDYGGGGVVSTFDIFGGSSTATAEIINTTISGNFSASAGGGITVADGTLTIRNSTIVQNTAAIAGGGIATLGDVQLYNSILAGNTAMDGDDGYTASFPPFGLTGVINGDGNNLVGKVSGDDSSEGSVRGSIGTGSDLTLSSLGVGISDVIDTNLLLNDGLTETHALVLGSAAINAGNTTLALDDLGNSLTTDQRGYGFERTKGSAVDIGAVEFPSLGLFLQGDDTNNRLSGSDEADILSGLGGRDSLKGGIGADTLFGGNGNDSLKGGMGTDTLFGGNGNDRLDGGMGADILKGDEGIDTVVYRKSTLGVVVDLSSTVAASGGDADGDTLFDIERVVGSNFGDTLTGDSKDNNLTGSAGDDTLSGKEGDDRLNGGIGADTLNGDSGNDNLNGREGADTLNGGDGNDKLTGGEGADILIGGLGVDTFNLKRLEDSLLGGYDTITDLVIGSDRINSISKVAAGDIAELGTVNSLDQAGISALLNSSFAANSAAVFTFGSSSQRTFLALNNGTDGFQIESDAVIDITGFTGSISDLMIV